MSTSDPPPAGCSTSYAGDFNLQIENTTTQSVSRRSLRARQDSSALSLTLADGVLTDNQDRTGYIASNGQFQFDSPPESDAIYTSGFTVCDDDTLGVGQSTEWWSCLSGDFYNLYYVNDGQECTQVVINVLGGSSSSESSASVMSRSSSSSVATMSSTATPNPSAIDSTPSDASLSRTINSSTATETVGSQSLQPGSNGAQTLSTGASVGIGIGITLVAIALIGLGFVTFRRRRRKRRLLAGTATPPYASTHADFEHAAPGIVQVHEKDGKERKTELGSEGAIWEVDGREKMGRGT